MNTTTIGSGTVAFVDLTMAAGTSATSIGLNNSVGSSASGSGIVVVPTGGVVTGGGAPVIPLALTCVPSSLGPRAVSTCTVTLNQAAPAGGSSVTLSSSSAALTLPASVTIAAGSTSSSFTVTTGSLSTSQSAFITATLADTSTTAAISVASATDLAPGKTATQSSTYPGNVGASAAVDGNTDGDYWDDSVSHTNDDTNAWWQVDLGASNTINLITIWSRTDSCSARLSDYWVFVSDTPFGENDTPTTLQNRSGTWGRHQTTMPNPSTAIDTGGVQGRYIRVQLSGTNYLALAEVQVFTDLAPGGTAMQRSDLALGKTATQSSTYAGNVGASAAVNGNTDGDYWDDSVSHTNDDTNAWWQVDLGASNTINLITIWNRTDICSSRLSDYWVFVSDTPFDENDTPTTLQNRSGTSGSHQTTMPNPSTGIDTGGVHGRYIRVQLSGTNYLALAEVQVFTDLALGKTATQSSTYPGNVGASAAVDGNTDGDYFDGAVSHTNDDTNAWWQVDLGASNTINLITIWNRTDCCSIRLSDYWVFVSDTPFDESDTPTTLQNRSGTWGGHQTTMPSPSTVIETGGVQGRYIRVQLSSTNYLALAEVQVQ